jgi:hypothetical protein
VLVEADVVSLAWGGVVLAAAPDVFCASAGTVNVMEAAINKRVLVRIMGFPIRKTDCL